LILTVGVVMISLRISKSESESRKFKDNWKTHWKLTHSGG
jgi:hypothetical protein